MGLNRQDHKLWLACECMRACAVLKEITPPPPIFSLPSGFIFGADGSKPTLGEKMWGRWGKGCGRGRGFQAIEGFQYTEVNTWLVLTSIIKDAGQQTSNTGHNK